MHSPSICSFRSDGMASVASNMSNVSNMSIPIRIVIAQRKWCESENSGSSFVTPQQKRRRQVQYPHHRRNRKVSAPPELQAHLGKKSLPSLNYASIVSKGGSPNPDSVDNSSVTELIINLNNSNKLAFPDALNSGSDSGVPSEYSSWAAPVGRLLNSSPYEDIQSRSISASLEDIPNSRNLGRGEYSSESEDEGMNSPHPSQRSEGVTNPGFENIENQHPPRPHSQQAVHVSPNGPIHHALPHPLNRAKTDTNLLASHSTLPGIPNSQRTRTNSMIFQLNLANGLPNMTNSLPSARSVSMISLNTAGNGVPSAPIAYPNLSGFNDSQSIYSEAGVPFSLGFGNCGSQGSLSGVGYGAPGNLTHPHDDENDEPQPTDPIEKKKWFIDTLCENLSTMYAILLFMIGCVMYLADTFSHDKSSLGEAFNVYLIIVQLLWLGYIHVDVRKYVNTIATALEEAREKEKDMKGDPVQLETTPEGQYQLRINLPEPRKTFAQYYGFTSGRHGGSLYLKIGAAIFCLGNLIHSGLNLGQKILYLVEENPAFDSCTCMQDVLMSVLQPIYSFYQLFFIFKFSNLIINRRKRLSRFALAHCISSSLLFWVYTIIQETLQAILSKKAVYTAVNLTTTTAASLTMKEALSDHSEEEMDDGDGGYGLSYTYGLKGEGGSLSINYGCGMTTPLTKMINDTTPYLYPFSIEYNILIVGIWILLWENIGRMDRHTHLPSVEITYEDDNSKGITSNLIIYVDCHSSNRGLFAGLFMTVATIISIILFFIFTANDSTKLHGLQVNGFSELIIHVIMIVIAILAFLAIRTLDIVRHHLSNVDDLLLYICLPCIFLYAVFSMVPAITYGKPLFVAVSIVQVVQAVVQTALISDGLRRCSNSSALSTKKPGRELITFMVVANVALWLLETFEIKSEDGNYYKYEYYGKEAWTLLSHMTLPLALFYRFHSSVCLVDIWKAGYESESEQ